MRYKEIIIGIIIAVVIVFGFVFRDSIFRSALEENQPVGEPQSEETATTSPEVSENQDTAVIPSSGATPTAPARAYAGRPLDEVRFSQEASQSLSVQQKNEASNEIRKYTGLVKDNHSYFQGWLQIAFLKKSIGDYEGARDIWVHLTLANPQDGVAFLNLGDLHTNLLKDYVKAEQNYRGAIKVAPKNILGYIGLADLYTFFYTEKKEQAEVVLKQGIATNPNDPNFKKALERLQQRQTQ